MLRADRAGAGLTPTAERVGPAEMPGHSALSASGEPAMRVFLRSFAFICG